MAVAGRLVVLLTPLEVTHVAALHVTILRDMEAALRPPRGRITKHLVRTAAIHIPAALAPPHQSPPWPTDARRVDLLRHVACAEYAACQPVGQGDDRVGRCVARRTPRRVDLTHSLPGVLVPTQRPVLAILGAISLATYGIVRRIHHLLAPLDMLIEHNIRRRVHCRHDPPELAFIQQLARHPVVEVAIAVIPVRRRLAEENGEDGLLHRLALLGLEGDHPLVALLGPPLDLA
mmetsp:Transcript_32724/g.75707  ORF Transcript_32724/g.75707 Transcript_32724/m.75707 type:complete len:233 (-) Transcript_32724:278-976(-)